MPRHRWGQLHEAQRSEEARGQHAEQARGSKRPPALALAMGRSAETTASEAEKLGARRSRKRPHQQLPEAAESALPNQGPPTQDQGPEGCV